MSAFAVELTNSAAKSLERLPGAAQKRVIQALERLANEPRPAGAKKLVGDEAAWRIRVGSYRIIYDIYDDRLLVLVLRIGSRKDVYRRHK